MKDNLYVGGYHFATVSDAELAKEEQETIKYLESNMNYSNISKVMQLYERSIDTHMFKTPIGWNYLNKLRTILLEGGYNEEDIRYIPVNTYFVRNSEGESIAERIRPRKKKVDVYKTRFSLAVVVIIGLIIAVIAMFAIALSSDTPNMINYRKAIVNEYASWEQDIRDREDAVRIKEKENGIPSPLPHAEIGE